MTLSMPKRRRSEPSARAKLKITVGLELQIWRQISRGKAENATRSSRARERWSAAAGSLSESVDTTRSNWAATSAASGWSKTVRTSVATQGWEDLGTLVKRSRK